MLQCGELVIKEMKGNIEFKDIGDIREQLENNIDMFKDKGVEYILVKSEGRELFWFKLKEEAIKMVDVKTSKGLDNICILEKKP